MTLITPSEKILKFIQEFVILMDYNFASDDRRKSFAMLLALRTHKGIVFKKNCHEFIN